MAWWWWIGAFGLVAGATVLRNKSLRRKVVSAIGKQLHGRAQRPRATSRPAGRTSKPAPRATRRPTPLRTSPLAPAPLATSTIARRPVLRVQKCSLACRKSRKSASTCDCACGGRDHGQYVTGTAAALRQPTSNRGQRAGYAASAVAARNAERARQRQQAAARSQKLQADAAARLARHGKGGS